MTKKGGTAQQYKKQSSSRAPSKDLVETSMDSLRYRSRMTQMGGRAKSLRHREVHSATAIHHDAQHSFIQSAGLPRYAYGFARNDTGGFMAQSNNKNESCRTDVRHLNFGVEIPQLRFGMTLIFVLILFLTVFPASAQNASMRLKFVFPFGDFKPKICQPQYMTGGGCCEPPQSIYQYNPTVKGCCTPPNEVHGTGTNQRCCTPWHPADQSRWGQTTASPCGGYCGAPDVIYSYNGYRSCCSNCAAADGVVAWQSSDNVCGTCCSRIPESCGNAGVRVCEPDTGSAYCSSDITKCDPPTDWIAGTSGEGGYSCCASCDGKRWGQTAESCGTCCHSLSAYYSGTCIAPCQDVSYTIHVHGQTRHFTLVNASSLISVFGPYSYDYQLTINGYVDNCYVFKNDDGYFYDRCYDPYPHPSYIHTNTIPLPRDTQVSFFIVEYEPHVLLPGNLFGFRGTITMTCPTP